MNQTLFEMKIGYIKQYQVAHALYMQLMSDAVTSEQAARFQSWWDRTSDRLHTLISV